MNIFNTKQVPYDNYISICNLYTPLIRRRNLLLGHQKVGEGEAKYTLALHDIEKFGWPWPPAPHQLHPCTKTCKCTTATIYLIWQDFSNHPCLQLREKWQKWSCCHGKSVLHTTILSWLYIYIYILDNDNI